MNPGEHINADPNSAFKQVMAERDNALAALADATSMGLVAQHERNELRERVQALTDKLDAARLLYDEAAKDRDSWRGKCESQASETLIVAWSRIHAKPTPWKVAVGITAILMHLDDAEAHRLLDFEHGV